MIEWEQLKANVTKGLWGEDLFASGQSLRVRGSSSIEASSRVRICSPIGGSREARCLLEPLVRPCLLSASVGRRLQTRRLQHW